MKIYTDVLPQQLLFDCSAQLESMLEERVWVSSTFTWKGVNNTACGDVLLAYVPQNLVTQLNSVLRKTYFLSHTKEIIYQFYIWNKLSNIDVHDDPHCSFGATIYLNLIWEANCGGFFVWKDKEEKTDYTFKAICPKQNMMVVNDTAELHTVTTVSPYITNPRFSIQIWGMKE